MSEYEQKLLQQVTRFISEGNSLPQKTNHPRTFVGLGLRTLDSIADPEINDIRSVEKYVASARNFLSTQLPKDTSYCQHFTERSSILSRKKKIFKHELEPLIGILEALKDDIEKGRLLNYKMRITAEVYGDLLDQTERNFKKKEHRTAAILAGVVLEDGLKKMAALNPNVKDVFSMQIEPISHELVKEMVITVTDRDKIVLWARIHNKAKHEVDEFKKILQKNKKEVEQMPKEVKKFLAEHLSQNV